MRTPKKKTTRKAIPLPRIVEENPFCQMSRKDRRQAIAAGAVAAAHKLGHGARSKATYSRTLAGILKRTHPQVIYHLNKVIAASARAARNGSRKAKR